MGNEQQESRGKGAAAWLVLAWVILASALGIGLVIGIVMRFVGGGA